MAKEKEMTGGSGTLILAAACAACVFALGPAAAPGWNPLMKENGNVKKGNKLLDKGKIKDALKKYNAALAENYDNASIHYNKGVAHYRVAEKNKEAAGNHVQEAVDSLTSAIDFAGEGETELKGKSFYNLGNTYALAGRWQEAAAAYKQALKLMPGDKDAAHNLSIAQKKIEEQKRKEEEEKKKQEEQEKQQQEEKQDKEQDEEKQDQQEEKPPEEEKKDQEQCDQGKKDEEKEKEQQKQQQGDGQQQKQQEQQKQQQGTEKEQQQGEGEQPKQQQPIPVTKQQAQAILDALQRGEKNFQLDNLRKLGKGKAKILKDW